MENISPVFGKTVTLPEKHLYLPDLLIYSSRFVIWNYMGIVLQFWYKKFQILRLDEYNMQIERLWK